MRWELSPRLSALERPLLLCVCMLKRIACGLIVLLISALGAWAEVPSLRPTYGQSPFPIWSELSYFENDTLSLRHRAQQNEPQALLAFYVLASGQRNLADYENSQRRVAAFIEGLPSDLRADSDRYRQAQRLHQLMHQHFLSPQTPASRAATMKINRPLRRYFLPGNLTASAPACCT